MAETRAPRGMHGFAENIAPVDAGLEPLLRARVDGLAKPPGALGDLEDLAVRIGLIQSRLDPRVGRVRA